MTTKTVQGYFGPKQITREDFVARWVAQVTELYHLAVDADDVKAVQAMKDRVATLAGRKWDAMP